MLDGAERESGDAEGTPSLPEQLATALRERFAPAPARAEELPAKPRSSPIAAGPDVT